MSGGNPCLTPGQAIGSYEVVRQIGEGGMGEVYEVFDRKLERRAALKVVPPELARNPEVVTRFKREAKALSQLRHPGVVHVFVYGDLPFLRGAPYFIMEYLEGDTLRARIQRAAKEPEGRLGLDYLPILQQIAKALAAVHQRGLVHRDLKPSNIVIVADSDAPRGERAKLLDFGIVKILQEVGMAPADDIEGQTHRGMILGTPLYMAPEQWKHHREIDGKTDVYALAVMMFLALTGRMPFRAPDTPGLCFLHCNKAPPSLDSIDPSLPSALVELVAQMLAKDPRHRPTMDEVGETLGEILSRPAAPRSEPMLPELSNLELVVDAQAAESGDAFIARRPAMSDEHPPLVDPPSPSQVVRLQGGFPHSQSMSVPPPSAAEAPGWEDDRVATSNITAAAPAPRISGILPADAGSPSRLSDHSLPVGSQYDLRPVVSARARLSSLALLAVTLLVIGTTVFNLTPRRRGSVDDRGTGTAIAPASPSQASVHGAARPVEPLVKAKLKANCQHMMPNASCLSSQQLTAPQQTAVLAAFLSSDASLCAGDRMVLSGLPETPRIQVTPKSMARKARANLLRNLKDLPGSLTLPEQLQVLCPDPE